MSNQPLKIAMATILCTGCGTAPQGSLFPTDAGTEIEIDAADARQIASPRDAAVRPCSPDGPTHSQLRDVLIVLVRDQRGAALPGALVLVSQDGDRRDEQISDSTGCVRIEGTWLDNDGLVIEAFLDGFAPAARIGDSNAHQIVEMLHVGPRVPPPSVSTATVSGRVGGWDLLPIPGPDELRFAVAVPLMTNPWLFGPHLRAQTYSSIHDDPTTAYQEADGSGRNEFSIVLAVGEQNGIFALGGVLSNLNRGGRALGLAPLARPLEAGEVLTGFDVALTIPLDVDARLTTSASDPPGTLYGVIVDVPRLGSMHFRTFDSSIELPPLEGPLTGGRYAGYAIYWDNHTLSQRVKYVGTSTVIVLDEDPLIGRGISVHSSGEIRVTSRPRDLGIVCDFVMLDRDGNTLARVTDFSMGSALPLPRDPRTGNTPPLSSGHQLDVFCELYPGWQPGDPDRLRYLSQRFHKNFQIVR